MSNFKLSRRTMMRGALGGTAIAVGLPPLEAMFNANATAHADGTALPRRLGVFFWGNGVKQDRWNPTNTGPAWTLSPALQPLAAVKDYVSVVSGMNIKTGNERGHHAGAVGILSGAPMVSQPHPNSPYMSTFSKPSIDQVVATAAGGATRFKSLELGISRRIITGEGTTLRYLSHNGPDSANPPEYSPGNLFNRLFAGDFKPPTTGVPTAPIDATRALRRSVLDAVGVNIGRLRARVGTIDKQRLDQHLENVRTIEKRLVDAPASSMAGASCKAPVNPGNFADQSGKEQLEQTMGAMSNLVAMALACDQTRSFSFLFSGSVCSTVFWQVNTTTGHHDLTHNEAGDQPMVQAATVFTMKMFGLLLTALKNMPEGAGNVLDNSAIIASSDVADGRGHTITDYPIVIAGKGGGVLKHPGVHYKSNGENTSLVLMSLMRAAGLTLTEFGTGGGRVTTGCTAIEA